MSPQQFFKKDLAFGKIYEQKAIKKLINIGYKLIKTNDTYKYDFKAETEEGIINNYEVKTTKKECPTIFIEFDNCKGKPTGISTTKANFYIFVEVSKNDANYENYYIISVDKLNKIIINHPLRISKNYFNNATGYIINKYIIFGSSTQF